MCDVFLNRHASSPNFPGSVILGTGNGQILERPNPRGNMNFAEMTFAVEFQPQFFTLKPIYVLTGMVKTCTLALRAGEGCVLSE